MRLCVRVVFTFAAFAAGCRGEHPAPGTKLVHFGQVDEGVFKGSKPKTDADFRFLQSKHVKTILDLSFLPLLSGHERSSARKHGIEFVRVPMNASPVSPSPKHVAMALHYLRDPRYKPIYFHCELGRDRTSLLDALYKMYFKGMTEEQAWQEMKAEGYKDWPGIHGLKEYLRKHPTFNETDLARN